MGRFRVGCPRGFGVARSWAAGRLLLDLARIGPIMLGLSAAPYALADEAPAPVKIAVLDFGFEDTSGEPRDQTSEHRQKLQGFMDSLRGDLASSGMFEVLAVVCEGEPCAVGKSSASQSLDAAKRAGVRLLLYGAFHKVSTMESWAKYEVFDVDANKLVVDRLLTYRDDNEEAWRRFERFVWREIKEQDIPKLLAEGGKVE